MPEAPARFSKKMRDKIRLCRQNVTYHLSMGTDSNRIKVIMAWNSGKDGALALYRTFHQSQYEILSLVTTVAADVVQNGRMGVATPPGGGCKASGGAESRFRLPCPNAVYESGRRLSSRGRRRVC